jgi:hypothetical protein
MNKTRNTGNRRYFSTHFLNFLVGKESTREVFLLRQRLQGERGLKDSRIKKFCFWFFSPLFMLLLAFLFYWKRVVWLTNIPGTLAVWAIIIVAGVVSALVIGVGLVANLLISYAHLIETKLKDFNEKFGRDEEALSKNKWEATWKEYELHIDLYRYYLDLGLKANLFFYFITGGILGIFLQKPTGWLMKFSLLLPVLLSLAFGGVFIHGAFLWMRISDVIRELRRDLKLKKAPDINLMSLLLFVFGAIFLVVGVAIILLAIFTE